MLLQIRPPAPKEADLTTVYDAIVVGSGAAGGMAAHVLTSHGLNVRCWKRAASSTWSPS